MDHAAEDFLSKTVILIAAAGDASRFILAKLHNRLYRHSHDGNTTVPLWLRQYCLPTWPLPQSNLSFLASHLTFIRTCLGDSFPVAVITGPNTNEAITAHLRENNQFGLHNVAEIEQESTSVFAPDGQLVFWENGEDLRAPNGMGGCIKALLESEWFSEQTHRGREYVYIWYANDMTAGRHIREHLENFAASRRESAWLSGPDGMELLERIARTGNPKARAQLIQRLEDSSGAYILHHQTAWKCMIQADHHAVKRNLPIVLQDESFLWGYKRETFLCDPFWKQQEEQYPPAMHKSSISQHATAQLSPTRAEQFFANFGYEQALQAVGSGTEMEIPHYLGIKKVGENLIDDWQVESIIDEGGMSTVYACRSRIDQKRIAIKTYKENDRWLKPGIKAQFYKEGLAWISLPPHPHIVEALRIREIDGAPHIYMELAEGGNLRDRLREGPLQTDTAIQIGIQVCDALQIVHDQGFLHKDVKPTNILFNEHGHAQLSDFGLAASFYGDDLREVAGTIFYIAPEFFCHGNITYAADIYSLGVVLYEMLAGVLPFLGTKEEIERQHLSIPPVLLTDRIFEIDKTLNEIVMACLAKLPQDRPSSAKELGERLRSCYQLLAGRSYEPVTPSLGNEADTIRLGRKRVLAYQSLGLGQDAMDICENLRLAFPENSAVAMDHALLHYEIDEFAECARICVDLLSTATESNVLTSIDTLLEMCAIQLGKREEAVEVYTKWLELATGLFTIHGDARRAIKVLELCVRIDPKCSPAWIMKGQLLYELGNFSDAVVALHIGLRTTWDFSQCAKALETLEKCELLMYPEIAQDLATAHSTIFSGDPITAEQAARRVLSRVPNSIWAMDILGFALEQQSRYDEAIACSETVLEAAPAHAQAHFTKGSAMLKSGKEQEGALKELELAIKLNPNGNWTSNIGNEFHQLLHKSSNEKNITDETTENHHDQGYLALDPSTAEFHSNMGAFLYSEGRYEEALAKFNTALELNPNLVQACTGRGNTFTALGRHYEALSDHIRAIQLAPTDALTHYHRGVTYASMGKHQEALADYTRAIQLNPNDTALYFNRGLSYHTLRKYREALSDYDSVIQLDPNDAKAYNHRGMAHAKLGELKNALTDYNRAIQLDSNTATSYYNRGNTYFALGQYSEALGDYTHAIQLDPNLILAYTNRGNTYSMLGKCEEALTDYNHAIQLDPNLALAYLNIGVLYAKSNQPERALPYFDKAASLGDPTGVQSAAQVRRELEGKGDVKVNIKKFLNAFFGKQYQQSSKAPTGFWGQVHELCINHIQRNVEQLRKGEWPNMEWAETRFNRLADPGIVAMVVTDAQKRLRSLGKNSQVEPAAVTVVDHWYIVLSVCASSHDRDFLQSCPKNSVEQLAQDTRAAFHQVPDWQELDFAHWILLINEKHKGASVHLLTMWNFIQCTEWIKADEKGSGRKSSMAPLILPLDLMREDPMWFVRLLYQSDLQMVAGLPNLPPESSVQAAQMPQPPGLTREAVAYFERGVAEQQQNRLIEAINSYDMAINLDPTDSAFYFNRAVAYYALEQYDPALTDFNEAIRLKPSDPQAFYLRGLVYHHLRKIFEELADFNVAIELDANHSDALFARAAVYTQLSDYEKALSDFNKVIKLRPKDAKGYAGRAYLYRLIGREAEAANDLDRAARLNHH